MRGTGLNSPMWIGNWGRTRPDEPADVPPNPRTPFFPRLDSFRLPTLDSEDRLWLYALAGLLAAFGLAATGPWG